MFWNFFGGMDSDAAAVQPKIAGRALNSHVKGGFCRLYLLFTYTSIARTQLADVAKW